MPSHTHVASTQAFGGDAWQSNSINASNTNGGVYSMTTTATGGGAAHNHTGSFTGTAMDFAVKYYDVIIASKDA